MGHPDSKWAHPNGLLKTRGNEFIHVGRPDGARAKTFSPIFSCGAFRQTCRRGSRDFWRPDGTANRLADEPLGK
jgi:hypothetical protein